MTIKNDYGSPYDPTSEIYAKHNKHHIVVEGSHSDVVFLAMYSSDGPASTHLTYDEAVEIGTTILYHAEMYKRRQPDGSD